MAIAILTTITNKSQVPLVAVSTRLATITDRARAPLTVAVDIEVDVVAEAISIVEKELMDMVALAVDVKADRNVSNSVLIGAVASNTWTSSLLVRLLVCQIPYTFLIT